MSDSKRANHLAVQHLKTDKKKKGPGTLFYRLAVLMLIVIGVGLLVYPLISTWWNDRRNQKLIADYSQTVSSLEEEQYDQIWLAAVAYNAEHTTNVPEDAFLDDKQARSALYPYQHLLNLNGDGVMGYLEIPKINIKLPIFHGTGPDALERGCGHLPGTSLPVGGIGSHTVLSAHRGLPSAKLFTDLDRLQEKDHFLIHVMGKTLAYEVDQVLTVLPEESDSLAIDPSQDYATLVTCTPYSVNTHRLLVRGHRVEYIPEQETTAEATLLDQMGMTERIFLAGVAALLAIIMMMLIVYRISVHKDMQKKNNNRIDTE